MPDFLLLLSFFTASIINVYYLKGIISSVFFLVLLPLFIFTGKNYFWFAFYFIIASAPANIFVGSSFDSLYRLPFYNIYFGKLTPIDLFVICAFFKALYITLRCKRLKIKKEILYFLVYIAVISISLSFVYGTERISFFRELRGAVFLSVIFSFTSLVRNTEEVKKFAYLLVPFLFLILADQLSIIFFKDLLINILIPEITIHITPDNLSGNLRAISSSFYLVLISMFFGLFFYSKKNEIAVIILLTISPVIIIITSIRVWTISLFILAGIYLLLSRIPVKKYIKVIIPLIIIFLFLNLFIEFRSYFNETIFLRFTTLISAFFHGELSSYDSLVPRLNDTKKIIDAIFFAPLFGSGLSHVYLSNKSSDLGFMNFILLSGITGGFMIFILLFRMLKNLFVLTKNSAQKRKAIALFSFFIAIIFPFLTTINFFAFDVPSIIFFTSILIAVTQLYLFENENVKLA
ncbi:hypothetical protein BH10BAC5_BH10BAC5_11140 [soil metagenome]